MGESEVQVPRNMLGGVLSVDPTLVLQNEDSVRVFLSSLLTVAELIKGATTEWLEGFLEKVEKSLRVYREIDKIQGAGADVEIWDVEVFYRCKVCRKFNQFYCYALH